LDSGGGWWTEYIKHENGLTGYRREGGKDRVMVGRSTVGEEKWGRKALHNKTEADVGAQSGAKVCSSQDGAYVVEGWVSCWRSTDQDKIGCSLPRVQGKKCNANRYATECMLRKVNNGDVWFASNKMQWEKEGGAGGTLPTR